MSFELYIPQRFRAKTQNLIDQSNEILAEYEGVSVSVRQLFYQHVARGLLDNTPANYKRVVRAVGDARLGGLVSWSAIEDRGRWLRTLPSWESPEDALYAVAQHYLAPIWESQPVHVEVWIEKDALIGAIAEVCERYRVGYLSCRGYPSLSELREAGERFIEVDKPVHVLHCGDHDPSGIDATRSIRDRLELFSGQGSTSSPGLHVERIAMTWEQVQEFDPPPNYAKESDTRAAAYVARYGPYSWELDALPPGLISDLIESRVVELIDHDRWEAALKIEQASRDRLLTLAGEEGIYPDADHDEAGGDA